MSRPCRAIERLLVSELKKAGPLHRIKIQRPRRELVVRRHEAKMKIRTVRHRKHPRRIEVPFEMSVDQRHVPRIARFEADVSTHTNGLHGVYQIGEV